MIHRIEIATTTRELLLGETPEVFDVYGYDEEGNNCNCNNKVVGDVDNKCINQ